jgi:acyl-CoA reductase-like NAD-dependent aldehyde dehydrogenase
MGPTTHEKIESRNPTTGEVVGTVPVMGADEVATRVARARELAASWGAVPVKRRARHLRAIRAEVANSSEELASLVAAETGKPMPDALFEVFALCLFLGHAGKLAREALTREAVTSSPLWIKRAWVEYSPLGVIGQITPWNYPVGITGQALPFALAAGNAVVIKPSELAPMTTLCLADLVNRAGVDLVEVVTGDGSTGDALVRSGVDKVVFTGSVDTGRHILAAAADSLTPVILELGGKDPLIVCADADITKAAKAAAGGAFSNAGQTCMAPERVFVDTSVHDRFVDAVVTATNQLRVGSGPDAHVGPLTRADQLPVLEQRLREAVDAGAKVVVGGHRLPDLGPSFFAPTVVVDVDPAMALLREESFGPILPIMRVSGPDEAVELANDSTFGLNASVFTKSRRRARSLGARLEVGGVNLDDALVGSAVPALPFGGEKRSGMGRLQGVEGLRELSRSRSVVESRVPRGPSIAALMFSGSSRPKPAMLMRALRLLYGRRPRRAIARREA